MASISSGRWSLRMKAVGKTLCWRSLLPAMQLSLCLSLCVCVVTVLMEGNIVLAVESLPEQRRWLKSSPSQIWSRGSRTSWAHYPSFLCVISIIVTPVLFMNIQTWADISRQLCTNMPSHTTARGHQLEGTLVMTEVIIWLFLGVCIMLVCDLLLDQSLIRAEGTYHEH